MSSSTTYRRDSDPPSCCSSSSSSSFPFSDLQLYQAFIFSVPIFFIFVLLFLFYLFYLRSRRSDWAPTAPGLQNENETDNLPRHIHRQSQMGLKKELREMLPIVVYKETFSINDTQGTIVVQRNIFGYYKIIMGSHVAKE